MCFITQKVTPITMSALSCTYVDPWETLGVEGDKWSLLKDLSAFLSWQKSGKCLTWQPITPKFFTIGSCLPSTHQCTNAKTLGAIRSMPGRYLMNGYTAYDFLNDVINETRSW
jgi:hypothetical protein